MLPVRPLPPLSCTPASRSQRPLFKTSLTPDRLLASGFSYEYEYPYIRSQATSSLALVRASIRTLSSHSSSARYRPTVALLRATHYACDGARAFRELVASVAGAQMANVSGSEPFYKWLDDMAKALGYTVTFGNAGTLVPTTYVGTVDNIVLYDGPAQPSLAYLGTYYPAYAAVCPCLCSQCRSRNAPAHFVEQTRCSFSLVYERT